MPLTLTAVMPNYNHAEFLPRAIEGIIHQTRPPDRFLILDDASTDNSVEIIEGYAAKHPSIEFIRGDENLGAVAAHEKLYRLAEGDFLYSAAADDDRPPGFFELAMSMAEQYPNTGLIFGKMSIVDRDGKQVGETEARKWNEARFCSPEEYLRDFLEYEPPMQTMSGATIFRRAAFEEVGWCRRDLGSFGDTFATRAIALKYGVCYVPEVFHIWHRQPGSFSHQTSQNLYAAINVLARAEHLMRSPEFADRFPVDYVLRWRRRHQNQLIWNYLLGEGFDSSERRASFWLRNLRRLPRLPYALRMLFYPGSVSGSE